MFVKRDGKLDLEGIKGTVSGFMIVTLGREAGKERWIFSLFLYKAYVIIDIN